MIDGRNVRAHQQVERLKRVPIWDRSRGRGEQALPPHRERAEKPNPHRGSAARAPEAIPWMEQGPDRM